MHARPIQVEIDLDAIAHNYKTLSKIVQPARVQAVIKANAYGHGSIPVAKRLQQEKASSFCVTFAEEGFELRKAGIQGPILILGGIYKHCYEDILALNLTPIIHDLRDIQAFSSAAKGKICFVHLKVDTGMSRLGIPLKHLSSSLKKIQRYSNIHISGLMTHLSSADSNKDFTKEQIHRFSHAYHELKKHDYYPQTLHIANSAAAITLPQSRFDMVRCGLLLYGPFLELQAQKNLLSTFRMSMTIRTKIIALRTLEKDTPIGYNGTFKTNKRSHIATIACGYADGLKWSEFNQGYVLIQGVPCPIVGRVSMDLTCVDVTGLENVSLDDEVVIMGRQQSQTIHALDIAKWTQTIPYEILCGISLRIPRTYIYQSSKKV